MFCGVRLVLAGPCERALELPAMDWRMFCHPALEPSLFWDAESLPDPSNMGTVLDDRGATTAKGALTRDLRIVSANVLNLNPVEEGVHVVGI